MKSFLLTLLALTAIGQVSAFAPNPTSILAVQSSDVAPAPAARVHAYAYTAAAVTRSTSTSTSLAFEKNNDRENENVRIDLISNIDATTITTVGFGLIAFNFFVLANMGDGGIAGFVATIINTFG